MRPAFLIGGGRDPDGVAASHRPFAEAAGGGPVVCLAADEGDGVDAARWSQALHGAGAGEVRVVALSPVAVKPAHARRAHGGAHAQAGH